LQRASDILGDDNPNNDIAVCGMLTAFINQVNANERIDTLTADQADDLRTQAEDIRNALNCWSILVRDNSDGNILEVITF
jgi:hypothetical protein